MTDSNNKRKHVRFNIPDSSAQIANEGVDIENASAQIKPTGLLGILGYSKTKYRIINISKGGMAFESDHAFKQNQRLRLLLDLPGLDEPLELTGTIRWQQGLLSKYVLKTIGIQFDPFGDKGNQNPLQAYQVLEKLEKTYSD
ncbi:MAG: PilZ domain-containing protein [Deltaproteobacteria bacterium]|nr:PilZ domain-containing protein [Deltaproteobacteria bacterium]